MSAAAPASAPLALARIGPCARAALGQGAGRVLAVFRRSFYLDMAGGGLLCVGAPGLGPGPLNALCALPEGWDWAALGLAPGLPARANGAELALAGGWRFVLAGAEHWAPEPLPPPGTWRLAEGLRRLDGACRAVPPRGLGRLLPEAADAGAAVSAEPPEPLEAAVLAAAAAAAQALGASLAAHRDAANADALAGGLAPLLGLGGGLTPAGDDLVGGALVALHGLGRGPLVRRLAGPLLAQARRRTGRISAAHLSAAAEGLGAAALHDALRSLVRADAPALGAALRALDGIGHTSGWDALAGLVTVCRALAAGPPARSAAP